MKNLNSPNIKKIIVPIFGILWLSFFYYRLGVFQKFDDYLEYQGFIEQMYKTGSRDYFYNVGYHGHAILTYPFYVLTHSEYAIQWVNLIVSFLNIPLSYFIGSFFDKKHGGTWAIILYLLVPDFWISGLRGWVEPIQVFWCLCFFLGYLRQSKWTAIFFGFACVTKPLAIVLAPFFLKNLWETTISYKKYFQTFLFIFSASFPLLFHTFEAYHQHGHLINTWASGGDYMEYSGGTQHILYNLKRYFNYWVSFRENSEYLHHILIWMLLGLSFKFNHSSKKPIPILLILAVFILNCLLLSIWKWWYPKYFQVTFITLFIFLIPLSSQSLLLRILILFLQSHIFGMPNQAFKEIIRTDFDPFRVDSITGLMVTWFFLIPLFIFDSWHLIRSRLQPYFHDFSSNLNRVKKYI